MTVVFVSLLHISATMSSSQHLREFIRERLTAAAAEIFAEVEKTVVRYEEELDAQRRMIRINWKQQTRITGIGLELQRQSSDLLKPHVSPEEEASAIQQLCSQGWRFGHQNKERTLWTDESQTKPEPPLFEELVEPGPSWIKEEEEEPEFSVLKLEQQQPEHLPTRQNRKELCSSQEVQQQSVALMEVSTLQEGGLNEVKPRTEQLSFHISPLFESKNQGRSSSTHADTNKTPFTCDICGKSLKNKQNLNVHKRIHKGERPFSCETCGKYFTQIGILNVHKRIHTGERPFSCETCGKGFSQLNTLKVHMRTHTGERPFSCETCGKYFTQIGILKVHKRIHTGERPFSCQLCGKSFSQIGNLKDHKKIHSSERGFQCETCGQSFISAGKLNFHIKQKHKSE